jgi:hypothetical protein
VNIHKNAKTTPKSGVERVEGGCMRHRSEEIRPGILCHCFDLALT